ncbi:MAG: barstar family protein [Eubacterium sp.]|nr:barstar family protein [Eubacterium sp.]
MEDEYIIDLAGVETEEDVQDRLMESLPLPDYYGGNLDALYDVLTEMGDGWHLIIVGTDDVSEEIRPYVEELIDVCSDASAVAPDLTVDVEGEDEDDSYGGDVD